MKLKNMQRRNLKHIDDLLNPGDLMGYVQSYSSEILPVVFKQVKEDSSVQFFDLYNAKSGYMAKFDSRELEKKVKQRMSSSSYIHGDKMLARVVPLEEEYLTDGYQKYYNVMKQVSDKL